jgi:predicted nucleic acid-binding protein
MIYLDASYILRLYFEDPGWGAVRALVAKASVACSLHGRAEVIAAIHRKLRENVLAAGTFQQVLDQFQLDCDSGAYRWLPLSQSVIGRITETYRRLPPSVFLRAADALHLAVAAENQFREIYSNDKRLLEASGHFAIKGVNILDA